MIARIKVEALQAVTSDFQGRLKQQDQRNQVLLSKLDEQYEEVNRLKERFHEYQHLESVLDGRSPEDMIAKSESLHRELESARVRIRDLEDSRRDDDTSALEGQLRSLQSDNTNLRQELEELRGMQHINKIGVLERQRLEQEKLSLEQHKRLLTARLDDLKAQIGDLVESQKSQSIFPELVKMDERDHSGSPRETVESLKVFCDELQHRIANSQPENPLYFRNEELRLFLGGLAMSQLHVFQGISGTGKTSLATAFSKAVGGELERVAVQAGWRDRNDILGHYNAFERRFYEKPTLQALYRASTESAKDSINIILLDEMNLSRPEQYFADFLSALEQEPGSKFLSLMEGAMPGAPRHLVNEGKQVSIPENVWFIGTANQDETTNELADKTHDRAFVLELPRNEASFKPDPRHKPRSFSYQSLCSAFDKAIHADRKDVDGIMELIRVSDMTKILEKDFGIGWGNRFERQAQRFLPVVNASGGTYAEALDHLLCSRLFRPGKVVGRYDIRREDMEKMEKAIKELFACIEGVSEKCLEAIEKDKKRMERG